ncbi:MAG: hypothetical protein F7B59_06415 [Desulfurococcales archaeon]|nr:hypothetical protein [Desulfurococcales archaeon]
MRNTGKLNKEQCRLVAAWSPDNTRLLVASVIIGDDKYTGLFHRRKKALRIVLYNGEGETLWGKTLYSNSGSCKLAAGWNDDSSRLIVADGEKVRILGRNGVLLGEASIRKHLLYGEEPIRASAEGSIVTVETNMGSTITVSNGKVVSTDRKRRAARIVYNLLSLVGGDSDRVRYSVSPNRRLIAFSIESYLQVSGMNARKVWSRDLGGYISRLEWHPSSESVLSTVIIPEYTYGVLTGLNGREMWRTTPFNGVFLDASWCPRGEEAVLLLYSGNRCSVLRYTYEGRVSDTVEIDCCPPVTPGLMGELSMVDEEGFSIAS